MTGSTNGTSVPSVASTFWEPTSVALLGVSRNPAAVTARPAHYLGRLGFPGAVSIVHAEAAAAGERELHGHRVVASLGDLDRVPDVAMVMVRADAVPGALRECAAAGVGGAVVIASGFEGAGAAVAREGLHAALDEYPDFRAVGPNSVGSLSMTSGAALTFSTVVGNNDLIAGAVGLVTQSGALGNGLLLGLHSRGLGVSQWVSTGDEIDLGALQTTALMLEQDSTKVVGLFLEGIGDGQYRGRLEQAIRNSGKRVVAMKSARSAAGRAAAVGHTGRVVGDGEIAVAALAEVGVDLVDSLEELLEVTTALATAPAPPAALPARVAVITVSGGAGVMAADEINLHPQLTMAELDEDVVARVRAILPPYVNVANPLDCPVIDDASVFERVLEELATAEGVDATIAVVTTLAHDYDSLSTAFTADGSMRLVTHLGPTERFSLEQSRALAEAGVGALQSPITAARALAVWAGRGGPAMTTGGGDDAHGAATGTLGFARAAERLALPGSNLPRIREVGSVSAAQAFVDEVEGAIVLKAEGSRIAHRSELGAVKVGIREPADVASAYDAVARVCADHGDTVMAQELAPAGTEVMVSVLRDPEIGVVALLRLGGIFVELGTESVVLTEQRHHWKSALDGSALGRVLAGYRGRPADDVDALLTVVEHLVAAVEADPGIAAVEANPVIVRPTTEEGGALVVDLAAYLNDDKEN